MMGDRNHRGSMRREGRDEGSNIINQGNKQCGVIISKGRMMMGEDCCGSTLPPPRFSGGILGGQYNTGFSKAIDSGRVDFLFLFLSRE